MMDMGGGRLGGGERGEAKKVGRGVAAGAH
jgi:hypothetical protein